MGAYSRHSVKKSKVAALADQLKIFLNPVDDVGVLALHFTEEQAFTFA